MKVKIQPRCKCNKYLSDYGRIHADGSPACDIWHKYVTPHGVQEIAPGPFDVYHDGAGHYAVIGSSDRKLMHWGIACDYAHMKAMDLNRNSESEAK